MATIEARILQLFEELFPKYAKRERMIIAVLYRKLKRLQIIPEYLPFPEFVPHLKLKFNSETDISIEFDDEALGIRIEPPYEPIFNITDEDVKDLHEILDILGEGIKDQILDSIAVKKLDGWKNQAPELLQKDRDRFSEFQKELVTVWGNMLELLEILLSTTLDKLTKLNETLQPQLEGDDDIVFFALNKLLGRACQVGQEIHILLSHGYADGAEARWRTLYEIVVVTTFIIGRGPEVAKSFIAHQIHDEYRTMTSYQKRWEPEGINIISEESFKELEKEHEQWKTIEGFTEDNGWAAAALKKKKVRFSDLEEAVKLDYLRPLYKEASSNVHANSRGTFVRLGLPNQKGILAGYTLFGVGDIARHTAFTMVILLENFLSSVPGVENEIYVKTLYKLSDQIEIEYQTAEKILQKADEDNENEN